MCDPDIALKAATGEPIRECLNCNKGCVDAIQNRKYISCVLNAENGDEATIAIKPGRGRPRRSPWWAAVLPAWRPHAWRPSAATV